MRQRPSRSWFACAVIVCAAAQAQEPETGAPGDGEPPLQTIPVQPSEREPAPASIAEEGRSTRLEDVVVTATKRAKSSREIPVTVHAYSGEDLMRRGATNLEEIVKQQPGTTKNGNRLVMRGVATSSLGTYATSEEAGRFYGDVSLNSPAGRGALADLDPFDMQTIEVAKGPQATLFGGTALAGAVRFIPNRPDVHGFSAAARGGIGTIAHSDSLQREANAMVNAGFLDSIGLRFAGTWRQRPGALDDLHADRKDIDFRNARQWRAMAAWEPIDAFTLDASYLEWREALGDLGFSESPERYETSLLRAAQPSFMKSRLLTGRAEYRWEPLSLVAQVAELRSSWFDIVDLGQALGAEALPTTETLPVDVATRSRTYELRVVSARPSQSDWWILRDWDYIVGLFYLASDSAGSSQITAGLGGLPALSGLLSSLPLPLPLPLPPLPLPDLGQIVVLDTRAAGTAEERALFFDVTRYFFDRHFEANVGGRLARSRTAGFGYYDVAGQQVAPASASSDAGRFNPKVALTWHWSKNFSTYASAAEGFRFGGSNGNPTAGIDIPRTFKSDSLWNYEAGVRTDWFGRTLRLDVTGFRIDWKDLQIEQISQTAQNFVSNVGGARIRGAEALLAWRLPEDLPLLPAGLAISLAGSYIDARITERFESVDGTVGPGTRLPLTPYVLANGTLSWTGNVAGWVLGASVSDAYSGERKNQLVNTYTMPAYHSLGATVQLMNPGWRLRPELNLTGINLTDEPAVNFAVKAQAGENFLYVLNRPRTLLLSLQLSF